jgi:hypothetical protein
LSPRAGNGSKDAQAAEAGKSDCAFLLRDFEQGGEDGSITPVRDSSGFEALLKRKAFSVWQ